MISVEVQFVMKCILQIQFSLTLQSIDISYTFGGVKQLYFHDLLQLL